jgi:hypothetical protein
VLVIFFDYGFILTTLLGNDPKIKYWDATATVEADVVFGIKPKTGDVKLNTSASPA